MSGRPSFTAILKAKCESCETTENLTINHIIPASVGGTHEAKNLEILCRECHDKYHGIVSKKKLR